MQAGRFLGMVKNAANLLPEELAAARELSRHYPYSQLLHLLVARGSRDQKNGDEQATLHKAAVYATDRSVLKVVMTRVAQHRVESPESESKVAPLPSLQVDKPTEVKSASGSMETEVKERAKAIKEEVTKESHNKSLEGDALRNDLKSELNRLHHLMSAFEATYDQIHKQGEEKKQPEEEEAKVDTSTSLTKGGKKATAKAPPASESVDPPLIEEIKTSKRKPKLVSPKVAEQGEIIDHFIKVAPTLPRTKPKEPTTDLSEESVNYSDNIVSETLVEILLKQGKKAKAIEMLKKLIWKFPQKKAYFAAQIESLKG